MLCLSRRNEQKIIIDGGITIQILRIGPNTVRLGIEAPEHINIVREELTLSGPVDGEDAT